MINETRLLNDAHAQFSKQNYTNALFLYGQLSSLFPDNKEYGMYALFCDIATEDEEKAISLYDYFSVVKDKDINEAIEYVMNIVEAYDGNNEKMIQVLKDLADSTIESLDAIKYDDFIRLVESRGSFRVAFEDIMFSTKVAIDSKEDFFDFVTKLIENDFNTTAYSYLDGFNEYFSYDKQLEELYKKLEEKKLAPNHK
ncbi:MAG: hypothetical protein WCY75_06270 [Sulfurimonadaceae bacterium]